MENGHKKKINFGENDKKSKNNKTETLYGQLKVIDRMDYGNEALVVTYYNILHLFICRLILLSFSQKFNLMNTWNI